MNIFKELPCLVFTLCLIQVQVRGACIADQDDEIKFIHIGPADFECPSNGLYSHETKCELFYDCSKETAILSTCRLELDLLFNTQVSFCDFAYDTHCWDRERPGNVSQTLEPPLTTASTVMVTSTSSRPQFECPNNDDAFYSDPYSCENFYRCVNGQSFHFTCSEGLYWNPKKDACDYPDNVDCTNIL